jgi:hypothetical protein
VPANPGACEDAGDRNSLLARCITIQAPCTAKVAIPPDKPAEAQIGGCGMTCKALTTRLALVALTMSAMAGQSTIYPNAGNVVGRYATDRQGTTTLYGRDGRVTR